MFFKTEKPSAYWSKVRKKAPKVPDITCPAIDDLLDKMEKLIGKELSLPKYKSFERKMDKLRKANEQLRESGIYWHDACKKAIRDLLGKQGK